MLFKCERTAERLADFALSRLQSGPMRNTTAGSSATVLLQVLFNEAAKNMLLQYVTGSLSLCLCLSAECVRCVVTILPPRTFQLLQTERSIDSVVTL